MKRVVVEASDVVRVCDKTIVVRTFHDGRKMSLYKEIGCVLVKRGETPD